MGNKNRGNVKGLDKSLKLLVKTSAIVFIGLIISKILGYTYRIIIARHYGPEVYGLFALGLSIVGFFGSIAALGLTDGLLRYIPQLRAKNKFNGIRYLLRRTLKIYLVLGIISSIMLIFASDFIANSIFHNSALSSLLKIMGSGILIYLILNVFLSTIRGFEEIGWYSFVYNIFQNAVKVFVLILLIMMGLKSGGDVVALSFVIGALMTLIASYLIYRYKIKKIFGKADGKDHSPLWGEFFSYSWPIMFFSIISLIFYWIDTITLGIYKSASEVGFYNAAIPIAALLAFIPELFMQLFFPMVNKEYSRKNIHLIEQLSKQITKWIFVAVLPIFALIFIFPGAAINLIFGAEYLAAENALRLLLIGAFISALSITSVQLISMIGKSKLILMNVIIASITNIILNTTLVPMPTILSFDNSNGLIGAALATLTSIILFNLLFVLETKRYLSFIPLRRKMISIGLLSILPIVLLLYLRSIIDVTFISIILLSVLFFVVYLVLILISKSLDKNDWMIIRSVFRKISWVKIKKKAS